MTTLGEFIKKNAEKQAGQKKACPEADISHTEFIELKLVKDKKSFCTCFRSLANALGVPQEIAA